MAKRIRPEDNTHLKILLYGQPGSTKTRTAGTAAWDARTAPVLHLDIGGNTLSMRDYKQRPDLLLIEKLSELNVIYNWLAQGQSPAATLVKDFDLHPPYKTIILDGITDIQRTVMNQASGQPNVDPATIPNAMEIQHFNKVLRTMTNLSSLFYKLPMHVIVTALERREQNSLQEIFFGPLLLGQSAMEVAGQAYIVGRCMAIERLPAMERKDIERAAKATSAPMPRSVVHFAPTMYQQAKDQAGIGVPLMADPTVTKILDLIEANTVVTER